MNVPKQDRIRPRTVEDLERMYKFGKRNEEMRGFATRQEVESVKDDIPDVSGFATKKEVTEVGSKIPTKVGQLENDKGYATTVEVEAVDKKFEGYATQTFVTTEIAKAQLEGEDIDLSGYAKKDDLSSLATKDEVEAVENKIPTKTSQLTNDSNFATKGDVTTATENLATKEALEDVEKKIPTDYAKTSDLADYAKSADVTQQISSATSGLTSKTYVDGQIDEVKKTIPTDYVKPSDLDAYVTETVLAEKGYATTGAVQEVDKKFDDYTKTSDLEKDYAKKTDLDSYAKTSDIPTKTSQLTNDSGFAKTSDIPTKTSQLTNDSGFLTSIPSEYVTETELSNNGYITSIPSEYVTETELNSKNYATQTDVSNATSNLATRDELEAVDKKVDDLDIPTNTSDLTNDSGFVTQTEVTEQIGDATSNLATKQDVTDVADDIPTHTTDLINDSGYVSESTVKDMISEAGGGISMSVQGETLVLGAGGGTSGDSGSTNDGDTTNDSSVNRTGEGENLTVYYSIDTDYLGSQGSMSIDGLTIEAGENSSASAGTKFPLNITSETEITEIIIVVNRLSYTLNATEGKGSFTNDGTTWTWRPNNGQSVYDVEITSSSGARAESINVITK